MTEPKPKIFRTKDPMLENANNHTFFVCSDKKVKNLKKKGQPKDNFMSFIDIDEFFKFNKKTQMTCLYEILHDKVCEIYDIDLDGGIYANLKQNEVLEIQEKLINQFFSCRRDYDKVNPYRNYFISRKNMFIKYTPYDNEKISFHILIRGYYFKNVKEHKLFVADFLNYIDACIKNKDMEIIIHNKKILGIDKSIYSVDRYIRMLGSHKLTQPNRVMMRYNNHTSQNKMFYASYISEEDKPIVIPENKTQKKKKKKISKKMDCSKMKKKIIKMLDNINDARFDCPNYSEWIQLVWTCVKYGLDEKEINEYASKSKVYYDNNGEASISSLFDGYDEDKAYAFTIGKNSMIATWLCEDNKIVYDEMFPEPIYVRLLKKKKDDEKLIECKISKEDDYIYCDFERDVLDKNFDSLTELIEEVKKNFPRVFCKINYKEGHYLKKDTQEDLYCPVPTSYIECKLFQFFDKFTKKVSKIKMIDILKSCNFKRYSKEVYKPRNFMLNRLEFNNWVEFKANVPTQKTYDVEIVKKILKYIKFIVCNDDETKFNYLLKWLSHLIQFPFLKTKVALFLYSPLGGTGKGSFVEWLRKSLFGFHMSAVCNSLKKICQDFNTILKGALLVVVEELPTTTDMFHSQFDTMKHLITDNRMRITPKGIDNYEIDNMCNFILVSNNAMCLKLESGDRRYCCFQVNPAKKGDEKYWNNIHGEVLTDETAKHFYRYLEEYESDVSLNKIPKTKLKEKIIQLSLPSYKKFIEDVKSGDYEIRKVVKHPLSHDDEDSQNDDDEKIRFIDIPIDNDEMYSEYRNFCIKSGEKAMKQKTFLNVVEPYVIKKRIQKNKKRKTMNWLKME